jgi:nicotinamidase-related amidase
MNSALLVIDIQNDYFPNGSMELHHSVEAGLKAKQLLQDFRTAHALVIHVRHIAIKPTATFFIKNTIGAEIHPSVQPLETETVVIKHYPNSFRDTTLDSELKKNNIQRLLIAGMMTHMCVDSTVRAAFDLGYEVYVVRDACATKALTIGDDRISAENVQNSFLAALNGVFCSVISSQDAMSIILERGHD